MRVNVIALLAATAALAGCATEDAGGPGASTYYACDGDTRLKVDFVGTDSVKVQMNDDEPVTIPADRSASGAKYMSPTHQFWDKGEEAMWTIGRRAPMTCKRIAMPRGM